MTEKNKSHTDRRQIIISLFLYSLPVIFFFISFFLLTTSGEDIWQGANNFRTGLTINPVNDAINAFNFNSRITDMYAWTIIDFFDYQFQFGPDIIFRLIDVIIVIITFLLATYIIIGHKPKLQIKDAFIFCTFFSFFIVTPFGRPFYHEFSMIHNYIPLAFATLLFSIPYLNYIRNKPPKKHLALLAIGMLLLGTYFGMSATITPLAFLATVIIYCIINHKRLAYPPAWIITGIFGTIIGFLICWLAGSGIDHYTNPITAAAFDYISVSDILNSPTVNVPIILWHEIYNFGLILIPLIATILIMLSFNKECRQFFTIKFYKSLPESTKKYLLIFSTFTIIHILGASLVKAPPRLLIPAYMSGLIAVFYLFAPRTNHKILIASAVSFTTLIIVIHTIFLTEYHIRASEILNEIKQHNQPDICIDLDRTKPLKIPIINLSQANIIVDWGEPEKIHKRNVTFCK